MTSGSIFPNTPYKIRFCPAYIRAVTARENTVINNTSCSAALQALSVRLCPIYCPATTAPPVASAAKILISRIMTVSTSDTAETASSPTLAIISVSAIPTVTVRSCSIISGIMSWRSCLFVNIIFLHLLVFFEIFLPCFSLYDSTTISGQWRKFIKEKDISHSYRHEKCLFTVLPVSRSRLPADDPSAMRRLPDCSTAA